MRKVHWHTRLTIVMTVIAFALLFLSIFLPDCFEKTTNFLQSMSTGLLAGIVLLFISGLKNRQRGKLQATYKAIHKCNLSFANIMSSYSTLYHETYHGKVAKLSFQMYYDKIQKAYLALMEEYETLNTILSGAPSEDIRKLTNDVIVLGYSLETIHNALENVKHNADKTELTEIREMFYDISNRAYSLYFSFLKKESIICNEMMQLDNSFID